MGDTGSMFLGFNIFIFSTLMVQFANTEHWTSLACKINDPLKVLLIIIALLYQPVFDALRVFVIRASKGVSPLKADRAHFHYYLLDAGFSHAQSSLMLVGLNILTAMIAYLLLDFGAGVVISGITAFTFAVVFIVYRLRQKNLQAKRMTTS